MYRDAPKASLLSTMIVAAISATVMPHDVRAATTLSQIISPSESSTYRGYRTLQVLPNNSGRVVRTLNGSAAPANLRDAFPILAFGHMSDTQICDDQSPARTPFLDRLSDSDPDWPTNSAYRPFERVVPHMTAAMVSSLNKVSGAPQTGLPLAFTLITGDMVDNAQFNETRTYIDLLDGGPIRPNNWVNPAVEEGPGYGSNDALHRIDSVVGNRSAYYHPDGTMPNGVLDYYRWWGDFPIIPNLLSASRQNFTSPGLGMPWYAALGNHDMSIQGNLPLDFEWNDFSIGRMATQMATGQRRIVNVDAPEQAPGGKLQVVEAIVGAIKDVLDPTSDPIWFANATPDPNRLVLDKGQFIDEHFVTTGLPVGHGFDGAHTYYVMPSSGPKDRFKFIALDTTSNDKDFGAEGAIDPTQWAWLIEELKAASSVYYGPDGETRVLNPNGKDKLIVLYGHHTLSSMDKVGDNAYYGGDELRALLLRFPNVVMLVNGHTHSNKITPHSVTHGTKLSGFYEVTSPAAADFPVQSRLIEAVAATTGDANQQQNNNYLSIYTTMLDADALAEVPHDDSLADYKKLASIGRELAYNDINDTVSQGRPKGFRLGQAQDRNTQLILPMPFPMNDFPVAPQSTYATHIVTQKAATKEAKILRMKSDATFTGEIVDFAGSSLQDSDIIGTGNFANGVKGHNLLGQDLVLRDANGNIRIKLLNSKLEEVAYPGFGQEVRGQVEADSQLVGVGRIDGDFDDDLVWRLANGAIEMWPGGSSINKIYLNASNSHSDPTPEAGSAARKIVAVGDFNADNWPDLLFENNSDHSQFVRYMQGINRTSDANATSNQYALGYDLQPGIGPSGLWTTGAHLINRKMRNLGSNNYGVGIYDPDARGGWQPVFYRNQWGSNTNTDWSVATLGDFNIDGVHDILWRHDTGYFSIWKLRNEANAPFVGDTGFSSVGPEWVVKGVLKNTDAPLY